MLAPEGYRLEKQLHATSRSVVCAAVRESDGVEVVLKAYAEDEAEHPGHARARSEYDVLRTLDGGGAVRALALLETRRPPVLVLERVPGISLSDWVGAALPSPQTFLQVAVQLAETLTHVHEAHLLHRDLHPGNVLVEPRTLRTRLIDFGIARQLLRGGSRADRSQSATGCFVGALHFIAPEQTGRMDRGVDYRSDLYGLGATLYYALTGATPFEGGDALALIHAHMARMPVAPVARRPELPATLSRIVLKLLQKEPEERYQTAQALHRDLAECLAQVERTGRIDDDFPLGTADAPLRPLFAKKLYGRDAEVATLHAAFTRATQGNLEWALLLGAPGAGKSALVHELRRQVANAGGYLVGGKFDLYRRDVPYSGWIAAFDSLIHQILAESDDALARWREQLREALGAIAGALVELVPDLGIILGEVPPLPALGPKETQVRLAFAVQRFLQGCARSERPLVLFLDDLQWADPGSRQLLEGLPEIKGVPLLVLGAYRDTEVDAAHPLVALLEHLDRSLHCTRIELGELGPAASQQMLADALGRAESEVAALTQVVVRKTGSNPLLIQQFVLHMHALGLIRFAHPAGWRWDDAAIAAADIPDGAVAMLMAKLGRLDPGARELIEFASCVGDEFDLEHLVELSGRDEPALERPLFTLLEDGLIAPSSRGFRFVHDRIREAAQGLITPERRVQLHLSMARLLQKSIPAASLADRAFELADHWNHALDVLGEDERVQALRVDCAAGTRALGAGAAATARTYFGFAEKLFRDEDWERDAGLAFALFTDACEAAYQTRELDAALALLDRLQARPLDRHRQSLADIKRIAVLTVDRPDAALDVLLGALRRFGLRWPKKPSIPRAVFSILYTGWRIGAADETVFRPRVDSQAARDWELQDRLVKAGGAVMLSSSVLLVAIATNRTLRMDRRHGVNDGIGLTLSAFANAWREAGGSWTRFATFLRASQQWIDRVPSPMHARGQFVLDAFALALMKPRRSLAESLMRLGARFRELGDLEYADYAMRVHLHYLVVCGEPLESVFRAAASTQPKDQAMVEPYRFLHQLGAEPVDWDAEIARAEEQQRGIPPLHSTAVRLHWSFALSIAGEHARAAREMDRFAWEVNGATGLGGTIVEFAMYRGLCAAALAAGASGAQARRHRRRLRRSLGELRTWAQRGPDFVHMSQLLEAEDAALRGVVPAALRAYSQAAQRAKEKGFRHHAALILERQAALLRARKRATEALASSRQALELYREWGAAAKVDELEKAEAGARPQPPAERSRSRRG